MDREKVAYATFDGVYVLFGSEGDDSSDDYRPLLTNL
jgi:hypothetical protein